MESHHDSLPRPPAPRSPASRVRDWVEWFGLGRMVVVGASVLAVAAGGWWLLRAPPPPTESRLPYAGAAAGSSAPASAPAPVGTSATSVYVEIVVHVAGAVAAPGVYRVAATARVVDAVAAAGGLAADAEPDAVNLAAPVHDGDRVYVPRQGEPAPVVVGAGSGVSSGAPSGPVDLNRASADELDALPGIGPATAAAIIAHRDQHGPFTSVDELSDVRGIGPAKLEALRGLVTV